MIGNTLASTVRHATITMTTTPRKLRELFGDNLLTDVRGQTALGAKLLNLSGNISWGENAGNCDIPHASTAAWNDDVGNATELFFKADSGIVTAIAILYFG